MLKIFNLIRNNYEVIIKYKYFKIGNRLYQYKNSLITVNKRGSQILSDNKFVRKNKNLSEFEENNIKLKAIIALQEYRSNVITNDFQDTVRHKLVNSRLFALTLYCKHSFISFVTQIASLDIFMKKHS